MVELPDRYAAATALVGNFRQALSLFHFITTRQPRLSFPGRIASPGERLSRFRTMLQRNFHCGSRDWAGAERYVMMMRMSLGVPRTVSRHRRRKKSLERAGSPQSWRGLDWMNFFTADVQTGFGAFVSFYLADLHWTQENVGFALTLGRLSGVLGLIPAGALAETIRSKRGLAAAGLLMIAMAGLIFALHPTFVYVLIAEILHGLTAGILGPAIAAISLGLVGRRAMSLRIGRNYRSRCGWQCPDCRGHGSSGKYFTLRAIFATASALTSSCPDCA